MSGGVGKIQCNVVIHPLREDLDTQESVVHRLSCKDLRHDEKLMSVIESAYPVRGYESSYWYQSAKQKFSGPIPINAQSSCVKDLACSHNPNQDPIEVKKAQSDLSQLDAGIVTGWVRAYGVQVPDPQPVYIPSVEHPANDFIFRGVTYSFDLRPVLQNRTDQRNAELVFGHDYDVSKVIELHL